jgi:hydrogenase nickel incorporation protein HypA/HybF
MHELSIAMSIVDIVEDYAKKAKANKVKQLDLEIGTQSGVVDEALKFAMDEAFKGNVLEGAEVKIHKVQAEAKCDACGHVFPVDELFSPCPKCSQIRNELVKGKELNVKKIIVD